VLTPELVRARRRRGELVLIDLGKDRDGAEQLSHALLGLARDHVGKTRGELAQATAEIGAESRQRKLFLGLTKLVEDSCEFAVDSRIEPARLRSEVFLTAALERRNLAAGERFEREQLLGRVAGEYATSVEQLERALYADLRASHVLLAGPKIDARALVLRYERAQRQAVLLRSVKLVAEVRCALPAAYRNLFNKLKFRQLLYRIERIAGGGYRIEIDGPFSIFESVTKYGLALALVLPALEEADSLKLVADVRWGKAREPLTFRYESRSAAGRHGASPLADDLLALIDAFKTLGSAWTGQATDAVLDLPGVGVCVPDLVFEHPPSGIQVFLEVLGFWSRDAVFRRIEMAQRGVGERMLFAVSSRLRVSEELLDDVDSAALYVYKGALNARAIERKLEALRTPDSGA
jgi:predicted nuclease of restriction endonuclease-like RecB superfamily